MTSVLQPSSQPLISPLSNHFLYSLSPDDLKSPRYYALSAICALFKHSESRLNTRYAALSLRIRYVPVEGTMTIDPETARNLELVGNMASRKSKHSLFGILNHTFTAMAGRLLRVTILSPNTGNFQSLVYLSRSTNRPSLHFRSRCR